MSRVDFKKQLNHSVEFKHQGSADGMVFLYFKLCLHLLSDGTYIYVTDTYGYRKENSIDADLIACLSLSVCLCVCLSLCLSVCL